LLSVDFGTSNTAAAVRDPGGVIRDLPLSSTGASMPSAVLYTKGRMLVVGERAVHAAPADPLAFDPTPKRRMAEPEVLLAGMFVPVTDLVGGVLAEALARAAEFTGEHPVEVALTYPVHWGSALQEKLAMAGEVAGIDPHRLRLVSEADAAAAFYTASGADRRVGERLAVLDLGAGHCSVVVLDKQSDGRFSVVASDGLDGVGGLDFDARIHAWLLRTLGAANHALAAEMSESTNTAAKLQLADRIRDAKEALSSVHSAGIAVSGAAGSELVHLSRDEFDQLIGTAIDRVVRLTESVLFQANTARRVDDPVTIHLIGGSSHIPLLRTRLAALGSVDVVDNAKAVVTHGALRASPASRLWQPSKSSELPSAEGKKRRRRGGAPARTDREKSRRRIRITSRMKKWAAGIALVAIIGSGVGVAGMMIYQGFFVPKPTPSQQAAAAPRSTPPPPPPSVPTPLEFTVNVIVTENTCAPDGNCQYKYTIEPKYIGQHPLPETPFTVFYEVTGGHVPQPGEFTVQKDQAKILKDVVLDGPPGAQLRAIVKNVAG
jgi:hypothetical protein